MPSPYEHIFRCQEAGKKKGLSVGLCFRSQGYAMSRQVSGFRNLPGALTVYSGTTLEQTATG